MGFLRTVISSELHRAVRLIHYKTDIPVTCLSPMLVEIGAKHWKEHEKEMRERYQKTLKKVESDKPKKKAKKTKSP